jgi:signal transduction histidine kinase
LALGQEKKTIEIKITNDSINRLIQSFQNKSATSNDDFYWLEQAYDYAKSVKNQQLKLKLISKLSFRGIRSKDTALFRKINRSAINLGRKTNDSIVLAEAHWDLAVFFRRKKVLDSAYYNYLEAQKIFEQKSDHLNSGKLLLYISSIQESIKDYVGAETNLILAIERLEQSGSNRDLFNAYKDLGIVSEDLKQYSRAVTYYNEALSYADRLKNNSFYLLQVKNNVGIVYRESGAYEKAIEKFEEVLGTPNVDKINLKLYAKTLNNLALCKIRIGDTVGAEDKIKRSIVINDSLESGSLVSSYYSMAELRLLQKDTSASIEWAEKSLQLAQKNENNKRILENLAFLARIDAEKASDYAQHYIALTDSLQLEERKIRNKFARIRFETDEFIAENEELAEEKEVLSQQKQMWTGIALGFFLLGLSVYIIIHQRAKNQKLRFLQQQQENNEEIFNLMLAQKQQVNEVKRMEQKRISEELHDGVLGKMLGARMVLTGLNKKTDSEAIKERSSAIVALKDVENEIRSISHELSHSAYTRIHNFVNSIEALLQSAKGNNTINTIFNYDENEDWDSLVGDVKINVYRIIQETLQNAVKHAVCKNFFVNFERIDNEFVVTMRDDGKGFKFEKEKKGIGMRNIRSRVNKLNGNWKISSKPGNGTTIQVQIPLKPNSSLKDNTKNQLQDV